VTPPAIALRDYDPADEDAAIELWRRTWQIAYPDIDFTARLAWWRARWRNELVPSTTIMVAETDGRMAGFVTVDPRTGYLDQIVVAPEAWGSPVAVLLMDAAKQIAPSGLDIDVNQDNVRAVRFYQRHGFAIAGEHTNPRSGAPVYRMTWRPQG
jgi:putative acetyltransferase